MSRPQTWVDEASCRGLGEFFFPEDGEPARPAKRVCAACPVLKDCRAWNDEAEHHSVSASGVFGVYGGESPKERVARRKAERREALGVAA